MSKIIALFALLGSGALAGCEIMVDRYDSGRPSFTVGYDGDAGPGVQIAREYCAVYGLSAVLNRTEEALGETVAIFDCRRPG